MKRFRDEKKRKDHARLPLQFYIFIFWQNCPRSFIG